MEKEFVVEAGSSVVFLVLFFEESAEELVGQNGAAILLFLLLIFILNPTVSKNSSKTKVLDSVSIFIILDLMLKMSVRKVVLSSGTS